MSVKLAASAPPPPVSSGRGLNGDGCLAGALRSLFVAAAIGVIANPAAGASAAGPPPADKGYRLIDGYIPRFTQKREMNARFGHQLEEFREEILSRGEAGEYIPCSSQILEETEWLVGYTRDAERIERRLGDLRDSLKLTPAEQASAGQQSPTDGSWGECYEAWFLRMHASVDPIKELLARGERPAHPLKFLGAVDRPEKIVEKFRKLKISNVLEDGVDHRKELNLTVTGLGQLLFLPALEPVFPAGWPREDVAKSLIEFMDSEWQDPKSGYWGAWYRIGDETIKTEDLSITFHIASYRSGKINYLPELVRTTYRTRERVYPYGWQDRGTQNCHHAYDVVRLVRFGWPQMTESQAAFARAQLVIILVRTIRLSINTVGQVDTRPYGRVGEAYYFCTSLLDELGFFRPSRNFWSAMTFDGGPELRDKLLSQIEHLPQGDPMVGAARRKLETRD